ncbi:MAG: DoxX family membrane protein [Solirubrobacterales bacterium]|nr:DoxX family membrane protein [Solirubrobacterales bacterium]
MNLGFLVLRVIVGLLLAGHGAQKLFGWFGGHGASGTGGFFESLGLKPGRTLALGAGAAELGGGALLALGLLTPLAAALITAVMVTAIITVHFAKGVWATEGGYEYNVVLIAVAFALAGAGAGAWSLDDALGLDLTGAGWALGSLAVGVLGGVGGVIVGRAGHRRAEQRDRGPRDREAGAPA